MILDDDEIERLYLRFQETGGDQGPEFFEAHDGVAGVVAGIVAVGGLLFGLAVIVGAGYLLSKVL